MPEPVSTIDYREPESSPPPESGLAGFFGFARNGTSLNTEILAGLTESRVGGETYDREWPERARKSMW